MAFKVLTIPNADVSNWYVFGPEMNTQWDRRTQMLIFSHKVKHGEQKLI